MIVDLIQPHVPKSERRLMEYWTAAQDIALAVYVILKQVSQLTWPKVIMFCWGRGIRQAMRLKAMMGSMWMAACIMAMKT